MQFHSTNSENLLVSKLQQIHPEKERWQLVTLHMAKLSEKSKSSLKIAHSLIQSETTDVAGDVYLCRNGNIFILYDDHHRAAVEAMIQKLKNLFIEDPLIRAPLYGDQFHHLQDLEQAYEGLFTHVHGLLAELSRQEEKPALEKSTVVDEGQFRRARKLRRTRHLPLVLLAEDNHFSLQLAESFLNKKGLASVIAAENGAKALELYCLHAPDILFLDIEMPSMDGHEVLKAVDKIDVDAFVVMLTAKAYQTDVIKAKTNHARGYITKPFTPEKLEEYIRRYQDEFKK